ncbi:hypothetical protein NKG94_46145 [Micromonospora sp. M12]
MVGYQLASSDGHPVKGEVRFTHDRHRRRPVRLAVGRRRHRSGVVALGWLVGRWLALHRDTVGHTRQPDGVRRAGGIGAVRLRWALVDLGARRPGAARRPRSRPRVPSPTWGSMIT